ncbi:TfuA-like protein [Corallococcus terminator]|uniref:TfuA-like core domain-containing protein n=1 Tax=Corallococcus terminator TaxID=2316733 RepID=A0A3A8IYX2_9BACT|nr:TfuA-like protein [Corallococcus terminator]RKG88415.1 hypothetical protein D7V88_14350 [Corallococcus terminator]
MIYVFAGPTLPAQEGRRELDAVFLPPAAQGDVYRAALERPEALGLIDGYFDCVPAVWHKEILWAMAQGIHVFGGASMGALRAAELAPFGMEGVGRIAEAFLSGELEDDDEVAVTHASAEEDFRALSEAMVNIRATLEVAEKQGIVGADARGLLERLAKQLHFPDRSYPALLSQAALAGLPAAVLRRLREWLPQGRLDQKRADALAMLRRMRERLAAHPGPKQVAYVLAHTDAWEAARQGAGRLPSGGANHEPLPEEVWREELGVSGLFPRLRMGALARALSLEEARRQGHEVSTEAVHEACEQLRREQGLNDLEPFARWLMAQRIDAPARFFQDEAEVRRVESLLEPEMLRCLPDHLRSVGMYGVMLERARQKARALALRGLERPGLKEAGLSEEALWSWYFTERLGRPVPPDLGQHAREAGFANTEALLRAVLRERCFLQLEALEQEASACSRD